MSREGCSPNNPRAERFFGRPEVKFFYERDWQGAAIGEFVSMLDACLWWYRDRGIKSDLGYISPMQRPRKLGLVA